MMLSTPERIAAPALETTVTLDELALSGGGRLHGVEQRVTRYGELNAERNNAVFVAHALTGDSRVAQWWPGIVGEGRLIDPRHWCVIGINALGSCYGSTGPTGAHFPRITVRDIVAAQGAALDRLGIDRLALVIGGSLGGMQALQWTIDYPHRVDRAIAVGAHDRHSAMGIALNAVQRDAIALDPRAGIRLARKIAMLSYKSDELFSARHGRSADRHARFGFDVEGYLEYQAEVFQARMDPHSYVALTHAMDSFEIRDDMVHATTPKLHFVGITSDWLFKARDVRAAADRFARLGFASTYSELQSAHGHDAFLAETPALAALLQPDLASAQVAADTQ